MIVFVWLVDWGEVKKGKNMNNKSILITGGTGSFGNHFVKSILRDFEPHKIIIYYWDEYKQFLMI